MPGEAARLFNAAIDAASISALDEVGFFDALKAQGRLDLDAYCAAEDLDRPSIEAMLHGLQCFDVVTLADDRGSVVPGAAFDDVFRNKGYFLWLVRGYGRMLENFGTILRNGARTGDYYERDGAYIARAGKDYGGQFVDADFDTVLAQAPFAKAADLGCGSAGRLIGLLERDPALRGVGVERNAGAVEVARGLVADAGLADRLEIVHADVGALEAHRAFADVDLVFSFFMAHDLWPREQCKVALDNIHAVFPNTARFLLCDTYRSDAAATPDYPIFTLGFEVTHAMMGQYVPNVAEWLDLFGDTNWSVAGQHPIGIPYSCVFDLRRD